MGTWCLRAALTPKTYLPKDACREVITRNPKKIFFWRFRYYQSVAPKLSTSKDNVHAAPCCCVPFANLRIPYPAPTHTPWAHLPQIPNPCRNMQPPSPYERRKPILELLEALPKYQVV